MITIATSNEERLHIAHGDMKVLKKVLEAESVKLVSILKENAKPDDFRFYQGQAQFCDGLIKLLP